MKLKDNFLKTSAGKSLCIMKICNDYIILQTCLVTFSVEKKTI